MAEVEPELSAIAHTDPRSHGDRTPVVLDCEYALLGALLQSETTEQAVTVLGAVADEDFANPWFGRRWHWLGGWCTTETYPPRRFCWPG
jgi:hypothetical protein